MSKSFTCRFYVLFLLISALTRIASAQNAVVPCATDETYRAHLATDSLYRRFVQSAQPAQDKSADDSTTLYTVPVVFVVYHLGEPVGTGSNVSEAALQLQVDLMNRMFAGERPNYVGPDARIRFVLARRSLACGAANGVVRVDARSVSGYQANGLAYSDGTMASQLRSLSPDYASTVSTDFVTIRVFHRVAGAAGWAYYGGDIYIGVGNMTDASPYNMVLTHEMGHALFLYHTFNGSYESTPSVYSCPANDNPETQGDMVADTDPHRLNEPVNACDPNVGTTINNCVGRPFGLIGSNFMSYGCNRKLFTRGQITRMRSYLTGSLRSLITSPYLAPLPDGDIKAACIPTSTRPASNSPRKGIRRVQFQSIDNRTDNYPFQDGHYRDYSCVYRATVTAGQSYSLVVDGVGRYRRAYIDYNNDGAFDEATELVWSSENGSRGLVMIPSNTTMDRQLRLRVIVDDGSMAPTACSLPGHATDGSGEVEDYAVRILPADTPVSLSLGSVPSGYLCQGQTSIVSVSHMGTFGADNRFIVQLSDASGGFDNPVEIGSGETGPVAISLPVSVGSSGSRRIRVVSTNPVLISESGSLLQLGEQATATISGSSTLVSGTTTATLSFLLTGTKPWTFSLTKNGSSWGGFGGINVSPMSFTFAPMSSGIYELSSVSNVCGIGTTAGSTTILVPCIAPTGLNESRYSLNIIRTTWDYIWGNTYTLQWKEATATTWNSFTNVTSPGWLVSGLDYGKTYVWRLKTNCIDGESDWSAERIVVMDCPVSQYLSENVTASSAQLNWNSLGIGFTYSLRWRVAGSSTWNDVDMGTGTTYLLNNLSGSATYQWQVRTNCGSAGTSAYSELRQFSTTCVPPTQLYSYDVTASTAQIAWYGSANSTYELRYRVSGGSTWTTRTGIMSAFYSLTGLTTNTMYECQVRTICSESVVSAYSSSLYVTPTCQPVATWSMSERNITPSSVQLQWQTSSQTRYVVRWRPTGSPTWQTSTTLTAGSSGSQYYTATNLSSGSVHEWQVQSFCEGGSTSISSTRTFTATCQVPTQSGVGFNLRTATVYFGPSSDLVKQVRWRAVGASTWTESVTTTNNSSPIYDLAYDVRYEWQVRTVCSTSEASAYSGSSTFALPCWLTSGGQTNSVRSTSAQLNWGVGGGTYEVRWRAVGAANWTTIPALTTTYYSLTGLTTGVAYEWQVRTFCSTTLASEYTYPQSFTAACPLPRNLYENAIGGTSARLSWSYEFGMRYTLQWRVMGSADWQSSGTLATGSPDALTGLTPGSAYEWRVLTDCEGTLTPSASRTFTADCGPPMRSSMYTYNLSSGAISLSWGGTFGLSGITYQVRYRPVGTTTWAESTTLVYSNTTIRGLTNNTAYEWQVQRLCDGVGGGYSVLGPPFTTTCLTPTAYMTPPGDNSAFVYWTGSSSELYSLDYRIKDAPNWTTISSLTTTSYSLSLTPGTAYEYRVRTACTDGTFSNVSNTLSFTTLPACDPNEPNNSAQTATPVLGTSFTLTGLCLNRPGDMDWYRWVFGEETYYVIVGGNFGNAIGAYELTGQTDNGVLTVATRSANGSVTDTYLNLLAADGQTYRASNNDANGSIFSQIVYNLPASCTQMTTVRNGSWTDANTWSCNRLPISTDAVLIQHEVTIPYGATGQANHIIYGVGGKLNLSSLSRIKIGE